MTKPINIECMYLSAHAFSNAKKVVMYRADGLAATARYVENFIIRDAKRIIALLSAPIKTVEPA